MILATYFPSRMSYNTIQSSSLLDTAFSPSGLKSTQLTFSAFSRYILATLKLRNTLSVILMSAASLFFMQMNKNLTAALLLASPGPLRVWFNDACESMHEQYHLWPPVRDKTSHFLKKPSIKSEVVCYLQMGPYRNMEWKRYTRFWPHHRPGGRCFPIRIKFSSYNRQGSDCNTIERIYYQKKEMTTHRHRKLLLHVYILCFVVRTVLVGQRFSLSASLFWSGLTKVLCVCMAFVISDKTQTHRKWHLFDKRRVCFIKTSIKS